MNEGELRAALCDVGQRLWQRNFVAGFDGNLSARLDDGHFLVTPSGVSKGFMTPDMLVIADGAGARVVGSGKVSSEFHTHLAVYASRPEAQAVVHAHPPVATALTLAGIDMTTPILPEMVMGLGPVPTAPYATPGTREGAEAVRGPAREAPVVLLERHGAIAAGADIFEAYYRIEKLEHGAQTLWHARTLGALRRMTQDEVDRVAAARSAYLAR